MDYSGIWRFGRIPDEATDGQFARLAKGLARGNLCSMQLFGVYEQVKLGHAEEAVRKDSLADAHRRTDVEGEYCLAEFQVAIKGTRQAADM